MAGKTYIKDLTNKSTPSLSGYTVYEDGLVTYKTSLESIKTTIGTDYVNKPISTNTNFGLNSFSTFTSETTENSAFGNGSLQNLTSGNYNTGIGSKSLYNLVNGTSNTGIGVNSLLSLSSGSYNMGLGASSLMGLESGNENVSSGINSLSSLTIGSNNTSFGSVSLTSLLSGSGNVSIGKDSLFDLTGGSSNTSLGYRSGWNHKNSTNGLFLGSNSHATNNSTNEIVIGSNSFGHGSNSVTIGNIYITGTTLYGDINISKPIVNLTYSSIYSGSTGTTITVTNGNFTKFNTGDIITSYDIDQNEIISNVPISVIINDNVIIVESKLCSGSIVNFVDLDIVRSKNSTNIISSSSSDTSITIGNGYDEILLKGNLSNNNIIFNDSDVDFSVAKVPFVGQILPTSTGNTIYGNGTNFLLFNVGDILVHMDYAGVEIFSTPIFSIINNTGLTVVNTFNYITPGDIFNIIPINNYRTILSRTKDSVSIFNDQHTIFSSYKGSDALNTDSYVSIGNGNGNLNTKIKIYSADNRPINIGSSNVVNNVNNGIINLGGSISTTVDIITGDTTLNITHNIVLASVSGVTITLPYAGTCLGRQYTIKNISNGTIEIYNNSDFIDFNPIDGSYLLSSMTKITIVSSGDVFSMGEYQWITI